MEALTAEDYASIDRASQHLHGRGWIRAFSLNEMTDAWAALVGEVEEGYDQIVDEYTNDLACRDWLALAWPMLSPRVREARAEELAALDDRFIAATEDDGGLAIGRFSRVETKDGWWWRRRPRKAAGEFAADLAAE